MRLDELPRSDNVEDRRGDGSGGFPMGRTGGIGIGTIILLGLIGWALGINPLYLIGGAEILSGLGGSQLECTPWGGQMGEGENRLTEPGFRGESPWPSTARIRSSSSARSSKNFWVGSHCTPSPGATGSAAI